MNGNKIEISIVDNLQKDDEPKYLKEGDKVKFFFKGQILVGEVVLRSNMHYAVSIDDFVYTMERQGLSFI